MLKQTILNKCIALPIITILLLTSCIERVNPYSKQENFDMLWETLDSRYCFFSYKSVDWRDVKEKYRSGLDTCYTKEQLFYLFGSMLSELKDGHVNLYSSFDIARYWNWFEDYSENYYEDITKKYLGKNYSITGGLRYTTLRDSIGYVRYASFSSGISHSGIDAIFSRFSNSPGIIIDVRHNGGGSLSYAEILASRFFEKTTRVGYIQHKTGKGHDDFSSPMDINITPYSGKIWEKPVVVLCNRNSYSATNFFVMVMRQLPNVTIVGDRTGGGSGLPFSSELPIGWGVRFSASPILNEIGEHTEFGIEPDINVAFTEEDRIDRIDPIIESAINILRRQP
ncbi:MAG: S41 family peptidase [Bacteroidales bacterium]